MAIRLRTKKLIYSALAGAGIMLIIGSVGGYFYVKHTQERELALKDEYQLKVQELETVALQSETGYSLKKDVIQGQLITSDMLTQVYLPEAASSEDLFLLGVLEMENGKEYFAKTDLKANTVLTDSMIYKEQPITRDMREGEFTYIELPTNVEKGNYVDIRIQFPTGDDFVLLSKKKVKDLLGLTVWLDINEGEILSLSSAVVDAYIEGAKIYAIPYVDDYMQESSQMTYPVKENVRELIESSPNLVNLAQLNLTEQNRAKVEANLDAMEIEEVQKLRNGEKNTKNEVEQKERTLEERVNDINGAANEINQEQIIGPGNEGNED